MSTDPRRIRPTAMVPLLLALAALAPAPVSAQMDHMNHGGDGVDSGNITQGMTWEHTFTDEGDFDYHCHPHPFMMGHIRVSSTDPSALSGVVEVKIQGYAFRSDNFTVKPGTLVRWTNLDNETHTVTQEVTGGGFFGLPMWQVWTVVAVVLLTVPLFFLKVRKPGKGA